MSAPNQNQEQACFDERSRNILENLNTLVVGDGKGGLGIAQQFIQLMKDVHDKPEGLRPRLIAMEKAQSDAENQKKVTRAYYSGWIAAWAMAGIIIGYLLKTYVFK